MNITEEGKSMGFLNKPAKEIYEILIKECKSLIELKKESKNLEYSLEVREMLKQKINEGEKTQIIKHSVLNPK
jgi:hypothetical protein